MTGRKGRGRDDRPWRVAAAACSDYEPEHVKEALDRVLDLTGGLDFVHPGTRIAIKTNLVSMMPPEAAGTTHPEMLSALCRLLKDRGAEVTVGDSPGGLYTEAYLNRIYRGCGLELVEAAGGRLNRDFTVCTAAYDEAVSLKTFSYTGWLDDADYIINFAKLKTHGMLSMTCSVKNLFGAIPGTTKPEYHMRFPEEGAFANMLIDLNEYFRPVLNIVDAVVGMEGNGPTAGSPRLIGAVLASPSPYALDLVCASLIGQGPDQVRTIREAAGRGLGPSDLSQIELEGPPLGPMRVPDFKTVTSHRSVTFSSDDPISRITSTVLRKVLATRPQVSPDQCVGCRKCYQVCPARAITMKDRRPVIDRSKCIRCFCCQEFCPEGAMKVHRSLAGRIVSRVNSGPGTGSRQGK